MNTIVALVAVLCVSLAGSAHAAWVFTLPAPTGLEASSAGCDQVNLHWNAVSGASGYRVRITKNGMNSFITTGDTSLTVGPLDPATYIFNVQAIGVPNVSRDSGFSLPVTFNVTSCTACSAPAVSLTGAMPGVLWPPNHRRVAVQVNGMIDTQCPLIAHTLMVSDEYGSSQTVPILIGSGGGAFSASVMLEASRDGSDADGRTYTLAVSAENESGIGTSGGLSVVVPHDLGRK